MRLWAIFAAALLFRLAAFAALPQSGTSTDSNNYLEAAESIAEGKGMMVMVGGRPTPLLAAEPGYSLFMAFWKMIGLGDAHTIILIQIFFAALLAPAMFTYVLRRTDRTIAMAASLIYAFDPLSSGACFFILRELFVMLVILTSVFALDLTFRGSTLLKGAWLGISSLSFPLLAVWPIWTWLVDRLFSPKARRVWITTVICACVVSGAWMIRNAILSKGHYLMRRHSTAVLLFFTANYEFNWLPDTRTPEFKALVAEADRRFGETGTLNQRDYEKLALQAFWEKFRAEPALVAWRFLKANFWFWVEVPGAMEFLKAKPALHGIMLAFHWLQLGFLAVGIGFLVLRNESAAFRFAWGGVLYLAVFVFPFMPIPRYYVSFLPLIDMIAAYGLVAATRLRFRM